MFGHYQRTGAARIEKVDPPMAFGRGKIIAKKSPWLDFFGSWNGSAITIEAKSRTMAPTKLPNDHWIRLRAKSNGMTDRQVDNLIAWGKSGAHSLILWELRGHGVRLFGWEQVRDNDDLGIDRLYWGEGTDVIQTDHGPDILRTLEVEWFGRKA
jgi:hypothetical protein